VGNASTNVYAKFRCAPLRIKKALGIFGELITTTTTRVTFWDPPSWSKNQFPDISVNMIAESESSIICQKKTKNPHCPYKGCTRFVFCHKLF